MNKDIGKFYSDSEEKVPLEQVLKDMYENSGVETAARAYYYNVYASPEERAKMDREDKITRIVGKLIFAGIIIAVMIGMFIKTQAYQFIIDRLT